MSLKGNVKTMPLPDLLTFLHGRSSTGTLELTRENIWKRLYFEKGRLISSGSSDPNEYLGHFLIARGKITEDQLTQAMETQQKTKVMLGKILVMIGAVTEEEMLELLEVKCKETMLSVFFWEEADFEFLDNQLPDVRLLPVSLDVEPIIQEGIRRQSEYKLLRQSYPSKRIRFIKTSFTMTDIALQDPFTRRVYTFVDSQKTLAEITMQTHGSEYQVLSSLDALKKRSLIAIGSYGEEDTPRELPQLGEEHMVESGKNKLAFGKWEEAINLFKYVLQHDDQNADVKALLIRAEAGLVQSIYEETITPESVPQLAKPLEALAREKFSSEESFMVTRINGRWDIKSILTITPLREVEALRILKRLLDRSIIRI
jgi:hypothetical protein